MAIIKLKPQTPGQRGAIKISRAHLHKGSGYAPLLEPQHQKAGRNNNGHITTRHKGGGHRHHYRVVDFRRNDKDGIAAKIERIEYDPNRSAHLALVCYADGERRYIIAPRGVEVSATVVSGAEAPIKAGNTLPIRNIPVGSISIALSCSLAVALKSPVRPELRRRCWPARVCMLRCVCVPAKCVKCISSAARRSVKLPTKSTACVNTVRPVLSVTWAFVPLCAVW